MDLNAQRVEQLLQQYKDLKDFDVYFIGLHQAVAPNTALETLLQYVKNVSDMEKNKLLDHAEKLNFFLTFLKKQPNLERHEQILSNFQDFAKKIKALIDTNRITSKSDLFFMGYCQGVSPSTDTSTFFEFLGQINSFVQKNMINTNEKSEYLTSAAMKMSGKETTSKISFEKEDLINNSDTEYEVNVPQITQLMKEFAVVVGFDLYYLGFYFGLAPKASLPQLFQYLKSILDMEKGGLIDSANKAALMQAFLAKVKSTEIDFLKDLAEFSAEISKTLASAQLKNQFEVFYLGLYSAIHQRKDITEMIQHLNTIAKMEINNFINYDAKYHLLFLLLNANATKAVKLIYRQNRNTEKILEGKDSREEMKIEEARPEKQHTVSAGTNGIQNGQATGNPDSKNSKSINKSKSIESTKNNDLFDLTPHKRALPVNKDSKSMDIESHNPDKLQPEQNTQNDKTEAENTQTTHTLKMHKPIFMRDDTIDDSEDIFKSQIESLAKKNNLQSKDKPEPQRLNNTDSNGPSPTKVVEPKLNGRTIDLTSQLDQPRTSSSISPTRISNSTGKEKRPLQRKDSQNAKIVFEAIQEANKNQNIRKNDDADDKMIDITDMVQRGYKRISTREEEELTMKYIKQLEEREKVQQRPPKQVGKLNTKEEEQLSLAFITQLQEEDKLAQEERVKKRMEQDNADAVCSVCFDVLVNDKFRPLESCEHIYHDTCLAEFVKMKIDERKFPIVCPSEDCKKELTKTDMKELIDKNYEDKFYEYSLKNYIETHQNDLSCCPTADCKYAFVKVPGQALFTCPVCRINYCMNCRAMYHDGMTCMEFKVGQKRDGNDEMFERYVARMNFKQCPKCGAWVEKTEGCDHMACTCGYAFCYNCGRNKGKEHDDLDHYCNCGGGYDDGDGGDDYDDDDGYNPYD